MAHKKAMTQKEFREKLRGSFPADRFSKMPQDATHRRAPQTEPRDIQPTASQQSAARLDLVR